MNPEQVLEILEGAERMMLAEYEQRANSFIWAPTADVWKAKAAGIRFAIDTIKGFAEKETCEPAPDH